jgi:hypothetical protein
MEYLGRNSGQSSRTLIADILLGDAQLVADVPAQRGTSEQAHLLAGALALNALQRYLS